MKAVGTTVSFQRAREKVYNLSFPNSQLIALNDWKSFTRLIISQVAIFVSPMSNVSTCVTCAKNKIIIR